MRSRFLFLVVPAISVLAVGLSAATDREPVPTFTGEDLDRMFGPAPAGPSELVDKTRPEDWRWVEQFLDRQYERIDAERQYELRTREIDIAEHRVEHPTRTHGTLLWGRGYYSPWGYGTGYHGDRTPSVTGRAAYDRAMGLGARPIANNVRVAGAGRGGGHHPGGRRHK
jgi:hypothetical protein